VLNIPEDQVVPDRSNCLAHCYNNFHEEGPFELYLEQRKHFEKIILDELGEAQKVPAGHSKGARKKRWSKDSLKSR
jgi:hypothetical protein